MKNRIQFFAMAACCAAVMLFSGCEKEQQHHVITATIEDAGSASKVHLEDESDGLHYPHFDVGDKIIVNGKEYITEGSGKACKFDIWSEEEAGSPYYAVYPVDALASATGENYSRPSIILPAEQVYSTVTVDGEPVQRMDAPMCGASNTDDIYFHNLCSVLKVVVKNPIGAEEAITVSSIEISSPTYRLNYSDGLQISAEMSPTNKNQRESLNAGTSSDESERTVTLTNTSAAGSIAAGESKAFYIYLPTITPAVEGQRVALNVKVYSNEGHCISYYSRTARIDALQRSIVNSYNFTINPELRHVEKYFFNVGTSGVPVYVDFAKHNEGASNQVEMGDSYNAADSWNVLTPSQWANLFSNTDNGLAKVGNQYGWVFLPDGFVKPSDCDNPTALERGTRTITINNDNFTPSLTVTSYTTTQWASMEDAGAVFIPLSGGFPETPANNQEVKTYTYYYVPDIKKNYNMYFYFYCKYGEHDYGGGTKVVELKQFYITAGTNLNQNVSGYYVRQVL